MPEVAKARPVRIHSARPRRAPNRATIPIRLDTVQQRLSTVVREVPERSDALAEFTLIAAALNSAQCVFYLEGDAAGKLTPASRFEATPGNHQAVLDQALTKIRTAAQQARPALVRCENGMAVIAVPVAVPAPNSGQTATPPGREVLCVILSLAGMGVEPFVVSLQMVAAYVTQWYERQVIRRLDWEAEAAAAIVELVGEIENSRNPKAACFAIARRLKQALRCDKVIVGLCRSSGRVTVRTVSDLARLDRGAETTRSYEAVLNEAVVRNAVTVWPADGNDRHTTLAHRKLFETTRAPFLATAPLQTLDGNVVGAVTVVGGPDARSRDETVHLLEAAGRYLGNALQLVKRAQGGRLTRLARWFVHNRAWRLKVVAALVVVVAALLAIPVEHKVACNCALQPLTHRFAVAPYDGVLKQSLVHPGDIVTENQPLARMDDREIQWELSGLLADRDRAAKRRDTSLSAGDVPAAQMAQLEVDRLKLKLQLLEHRRENLEIQSNIDGMILDGDLDDATGAPVEIGQPLFEIAPLDRLQLEVEVPEQDLPYVGQGQQVTVTLDGLPYQPLQGEIVRIRPRAELREEENVFVAEVVVENADRRLRPGMRGRAKVLEQPRPLGWILFHHAWEQAICALR